MRTHCRRSSSQSKATAQKPSRRLRTWYQLNCMLQISLIKHFSLNLQPWDFNPYFSVYWIKRLASKEMVCENGGVAHCHFSAIAKKTYGDVPSRVRFKYRVSKKRADEESLYLESMVEPWLIYYLKANCWNFFRVHALFIVRYKLRPRQLLTCDAQKWLYKRVNEVLIFLFGICSQTSKRFNWFDRYRYSTHVQTFQKTLHQNPPSSSAIRQRCKKVWSTGSVKRQKESERKSISDRHPIIVQQL